MAIGTNEQIEQMKKVQARVNDLIEREFKETTETAILAGGLAQCIIMLLRNYPSEVRGELIDGLVAAISGKTPKGADQQQRIIIPGVH